MSTKEGDIIFTNATVIDGSGSTPRYKANVLVRDGLIYAIDIRLEEQLDNANNASRRIVNSEGFVLCPGFIDM